MGLVILIPVALALGLSGLAAFFWAIRSGQFEDLDGAALRILIDDENPNPPLAPRKPRTLLRTIGHKGIGRGDGRCIATAASLGNDEERHQVI